MSIKSDLKKEGINAISEIDEIIVLTMCKNIARRIVETFPTFNFNEEELADRLSTINMYKAEMSENIAEANYFYKNTSIYFNSHIDNDDLEEFAIHECIHFLQERKNGKNELLRMGLSTYNKHKVYNLALNEAAVQYTASRIIGIENGFEKYYDINLYTPSPSYYPLECALLSQIIYFTGNETLFKSTLFSDDDFINLIIEKTSKKTFLKLSNLFEQILDLEEDTIKINNKILNLGNNSPKLENLNKKLSNYKQKIADTFIQTQNLIITEFFNSDFEAITNLEELENFRRKLYKFSGIIGTAKDYRFFDEFYIETMNKLEHKCNILENGGIETALNTNSHNSILNILQKFFKRIFKKKEINEQ